VVNGLAACVCVCVCVSNWLLKAARLVDDESDRLQASARPTSSKMNVK